MTALENPAHQKVRGLIELIGRNGIADALMLDVLTAADVTRPSSVGHNSPPPHPPNAFPDLKKLDEAERIAVIRSGTRTYRDRHTRMTTQLSNLFAETSLKAGSGMDRRFDVLFPNYDANGRDLLIEAKPDPDRGSVRIAIGQLLDYRRGLSRRAATDLALLTITPPSREYLDLLKELKITALWYTDEKCSALRGDGKAWAPISRRTE